LALLLHGANGTPNAFKLYWPARTTSFARVQQTDVRLGPAATIASEEKLAMRRLVRKCSVLSVALAAFVVAGLGATERVEADPWSIAVQYRYRPYRGGYYSSYYFSPRSAPIYHPPSVHYDHVYHPDYSHWTPYQGWHSHGHYHAVPHFVPGHIDRWHGNHIDVNPYFHD
jgi:hypothetical protein